MLQGSDSANRGLVDIPDYPTDQLDLLTSTNSSAPGNGTAQPVIIVRAEEALIVILVLVLWVAAIALFFNRWGKIRMLEPYQPKFQAHRPSCPLVEIDGPIGAQHRSLSKYNVNCITDPLARGLRPRQNSVFVGGSANMLAYPTNSPRRAKSAMDIQSLVLAEYEPGLLTPAQIAREAARSKLDVRPCSLDLRRPSCSKLDVRRTSCIKPSVLEARKPFVVDTHARRPSCIPIDNRRLSCINLDIRRPSCSKLLDTNFLVSQV